MRKMRLLVDELEKLRENNQRLLIENDLLRSKCAEIEAQVTDRMLKEEMIRLEMENWPWK